jgi:hypothetical protein
VASLDVTRALVAVGALGAGARLRALLAFGCFCSLGTVAFGTVLLVVVGPRIEGIDWGMLLPHDPTEDRVVEFVDIVLGVGLLIWGVVRIRRPDSGPPKPSTPRGLGLISLAGTGMIFAFAAIADPTFVSLVVIAGLAEHYRSVVAAHSTWTLVSHTPLVLVLALAPIGENERVVTRVLTLWARVSPSMVRLVTGVDLLMGTFLLLDALWWFLTGEFFIPV